MQIINVIVIKEGVVYTCESFVIKNKDTHLKIKSAELLFADKALEYGADEDDMDSYIEDGCYAGGNFSVCLVHSEIQD
jgi:hypothetical protein